MQSTARRVAISLDDLPGERSLGGGDVHAMTDRLLDALSAHGVQATGFVTGRNVLVEGQIDARFALLDRWLDAGMTLGNHTFSHTSLDDTSLAEFQLDIVQGELFPRFVQESRGQRLRYFRAPQNHIGSTESVKAGLSQFLRARRQVLTPFTVEHSDYAFDEVWGDALRNGDAEKAERVRSAYLTHLDTAFSFFEELSAEMFDRQIAQIFLIHANLLNAALLDEMLSKLEDRGYQFVTVPGALEDDAYTMPDHFVGPVGISWFHRWSFSRGYGTRQTKDGLMLPETLYREPDPPELILEAMH